MSSAARREVGKKFRPARTAIDDRLPEDPRIMGANRPFTIICYHRYEFVEPDPRERYVTKDMVTQAGEWMPVLKELPHLAGINGNREIPGPNGGKIVDTSLFENGVRKKGGVVVKLDDPRLNHDKLGDFRDYVGYFAVKGFTRSFYTFFWNAVQVFPGGKRATPDPDLSKTLDFRRVLHLNGIVHPMERAELAEHLSMLSNQLDEKWTMVQRGHMEEAAYTKIEEKINALGARMEAAFTRQFEGGGKGKGKRRRPAKPPAEQSDDPPLGRGK